MIIIQKNKNKKSFCQSILIFNNNSRINELMVLKITNKSAYIRIEPENGST